MMALTATAIKSVRLSVSRTIGLKNPYVLTKSSCKSNLIYSASVFTNVKYTFRPLFDKLQNQRNMFPRTINLSMHSHLECVLTFIYIFLKYCFRSGFTDPEDAPDIPPFRLIEMFAGVTEPSHKSEIIQLFKEESKLRVIVATIQLPLA